MKLETRQILVVLPWTENISRDIVAGLFDFIRTNRNWQLRYTSPQDFSQFEENGLDFFDGIIGRLGHSKVAETIRASTLPAVNIHGGTPVAGLPQVGEDDQAIGRTAADYFFEQGYSDFACARHPNIDSFALREQGFIARLQELGAPNPIIHIPVLLGAYTHPRQMNCLKQRAKQPGHTVGLFAGNDLTSVTIERSCRNLGLRIPDDVSILGVNNDPILCKSPRTELSSIQLPMQKIGFLAGGMMDALLNNKPIKDPAVRLPPEQVVPRLSTNIAQTNDPAVKAALAIIAREYASPLKLPELARRVGVSQRVLEKRFAKKLSRSPQREIQRTRIAHAKQLLRETDFVMTDIAISVGMRDGLYLSQIFKKETGIAPSEYRKTFRIMESGR